MQFTLFSPFGEPLNERLAFINNNDQLKLDIDAKESYAARQKVNIKLTVKNKNYKKITAGSFSVAVTDETKVPVNEPGENTILSNLLLTSELKGAIEQPNYYFTNVTKKTNADLDVLMLTQGYRQFSWKKVLTESLPTTAFKPEKALEVSGNVKTAGGRPISGAKVTLFSKSGGPFLMDTLTNANGKFVFPNLIFGDSVKFVVQAKVTKGQDNVVLDLDNIISPPITCEKSSTSALNFLTDTSIFLTNERLFYQEQKKYGINKKTLMLKEVVVKDKKLTKELQQSQNLNGKGNADQVVTAKDLETLACGKLLDCLQAKLTGIVFIKKLNQTMMYVRRLGGMDMTKSSILPDPMQIVVDGNFVDYDVANDLDPTDVDAVEVLMGPHSSAIYGSRGASGMLIVTTKPGRKEKNYYRYAPGVISFMPKGFYKAREFYSPRYDSPNLNKQMIDLRSTIFWNPDIRIDKNGTALFDYFNADSKGTYRIVIEGIDADGNLGRQVYRYKVGD
ncbi:carboxypeptidase regulatory-like domain-containing protein [Mucilaginibacter sp. L3T2-6]|uniref:carboxypeptidase regulatory-like domain-containing protein n=1 Tax=Mucilaginibacter sp. L3T2-6 TaxID=3062491 RepID=UPI00267479A6|nr:carboxypeptidase regulatory-like domain-containing protein [Mucilaginibacter sp. L3T2-6]MDO3640741.1 carboxypeptidase regulatory-like domain-containing protein [Mucilaginibacter sp. L3T2-6]MDV6212918.1 carboxypeptidase regulatory-like domain-containing protein [Mucilaginibacter sp. L3T2-6]